jgi:Glycosyl hydrolase family 53
MQGFTAPSPEIPKPARSKRWLWLVGGVVILSALVVFALSRSSVPAPSTSTSGPNQRLKGFSFSPKTTAAADMASFYTKAKEAGNTVTWAGDWAQLSTPGSGPYGVTETAKSSSLTAIAIPTTHTRSGGKSSAVRPLTASQIEIYQAGIVQYAAKYKPVYLGMGIEINWIYEELPQDFQSFTNLFSQSYDAIKAVSPDTKIFTVLQLERTKGLKGGLYGGTNDTAKGEWAILESFPKADVIAFTTYPGIIYKTPAEIPTDFYSEISRHTTKPVIFTEMGWSSSSQVKGYEGSVDKQDQFIKLFYDQTKSLNPQVVIWSFLYDQALPEPLVGTGLVTAAGVEKKGWATFVAK